ncbi:hypothetical protein [Halonotius pteroides]|uniref:Uncharacterized protein n=1 Tax=Halonotius pteroides TaxID=268735 RepID=A0A3A6QS01_9EURY|nr:hypothetical protein [Halonotius pteroides]RJX51169.1 hypothetical protein DP106_03550 [Halonotius pteroides]
MTALQTRSTVVSELLHGGAVGAMLLVLGESTTMAAGTAAGVMLFRAIGYAIQQAIGDYADHVLLGGGILIGVGYLAYSGSGALWVAGGGLLGGWFLIDGLQHLRYGRTRERPAAPLVADGKGQIRGLYTALFGRLLVPFTLSETTDTNR